MSIVTKESNPELYNALFEDELTAREMFEKLGWKYLEDCKEYCLFRYKNENENPYGFIYFYGDKTIEIRSDYGQSYKLFEAINKQIEELGWNKD